jgi:myo-inositol-1(or 4)-monophosphatase
MNNKSSFNKKQNQRCSDLGYHYLMKILFVILLWLPADSIASCEAKKGQTLDRAISQMEKLMRQAGQDILRLRAKGDFDLQKKSNFSDLKTKGDCASQNLIFDGLKKSYPNSTFLGEEKCESKKGTEGQVKNLVAAPAATHYTWNLDPIDGTTNYVHGMPHFSISLALIVGSEICRAAVYAPVYQEFFYAIKDQGAYIKTSPVSKPKKLSVSLIHQVSSSLWITGFEGGPSEKAKRKNESTTKVILDIIPRSHDIRRTGSAALDLASIASGRAEGYWEYGEGLNWWDVAAGILLVTESGGKIQVTEPKSNPLADAALGSSFERPISSIVATNGQPDIHAELNRLVAKHAP